jgi:hypothetical protein
MTATEAVQAVVGWIAEVCSIDSTYDYLTGEKSKELPDIMGDLDGRRFAFEDQTLFPGFSIQQAGLDIFTVNVSMLVDNGDEGAAAAELRGYTDLLAVSLRDDVTLSGRVRMASPVVTFDLARPFVEYQDGTVGREMTMQMSVAELVEV